MKKFSTLKKIVLFVGLILIEIILYGCVDKFIQKEKWNRPYISQNEFLKTIDCAEIFDENPNSSFLISFEIRAQEVGNIMVYQQNGSGARYAFSEVIQVTQEYQEINLIVKPIMVDVNEEHSYLAFYGEYGTGVIPEVRKITIEVINE